MARHPAADVNLVLLFKAPHNAKRRLAAQIGDLAATAASLLCDCALQDVEGWPGPGWLSPASVDDGQWLAARIGKAAPMILQQGANLGERINHVDTVLRSKGQTKILFIGTDCPGLDADYLSAAARHLDEHDAVVGPSRDGGVVLMGARRPWPRLGELRWSTARLHDDLTAACGQQGWATGRLGLRSDVDTASDLLEARAELGGDARCTRRELVEWIAERSGVLRAAAGRWPRAAQ